MKRVGDNTKQSDFEEKIKVVAHRGGAGLAPENTITAFAKAEEMGADAIELDVRISSDGRIVVIHDPDLYRVYGDRRFVSQMTYEEISAVKLPGGESTPELENVLRDFKIDFFVEIKTPSTVPKIIELFRKQPSYVKRCKVISFFHESLQILKGELTSVKTGALLSGFPVDPVSVVKACSADFLSLDHSGVHFSYVSLCHSAGVPVNVWTVNSPGDISKMISMNVDSITSDRPDLVLKALGR